ncbi:MAG: DMT family transporter [Elusimicrobiota bacterium]
MFKVYVAILTTIAVWSASFLIISRLLAVVTPMELTILRFIPAALICLAYIAARHATGVWASLRKNLWLFILYSVLLIPVYNGFLYYGLKDVSSGLAALIVGGSPVCTYLLAMSIGDEGFNRKKFLGIVVAFCGLLVAIILGSEKTFAAGHLLYVAAVFGAMLSAAGQGVIARHLLMRHPLPVVMGLAIALGCLPLLFFIDGPFISRAASLDVSVWLGIAFLTIASTIGGHVGWFYALRRLPTTNVVIFINLIPFVTMFLGHFFLQEHINAWLVAGGVLLVSGIVTTTRSPG